MPFLPPFSRHLSALFHRSTTLPHILQLHCLLLKTALDRSPSVAVKLVAALCPLSPPHATSFFSQLPFPAPVFAWNSLIRASARSPSPLSAVDLFSSLRRDGAWPPDDFTYPFVLTACSRALMREVGEAVHGLVVKVGFLSVLHVGNTLLHMYACCRAIDCAQKVFDQMRSKDVVSWSSMIQGRVSWYL